MNTERKIEKWEKKGKVRLLLRALKNRDSFSKVNTLCALGNIQSRKPMDESEFDVIANALPDILKSYNIYSVIDALKMLYSTNIAASLVDYIYINLEYSSNEYNYILNFIEKNGDINITDKMIILLCAEDGNLRLRAANVIDNLGEHRYKELIKGDCVDFARLGELKDEKLVEPLIKKLVSDEKMRKNAAIGLYGMGERQWKRKVQGNNEDFRRLGESKDTRLVEPLIQRLYKIQKTDLHIFLDERRIYTVHVSYRELLNDMNSIIESLGSIGDRRAVRIIVKLLDHEIKDTRKAAALALINIAKANPEVDIISEEIKNEIIYHSDYNTKEHFSNIRSSDCNDHSDFNSTKHTDEGIGIKVKDF